MVSKAELVIFTNLYVGQCSKGGSYMVTKLSHSFGQSDRPCYPAPCNKVVSLTNSHQWKVSKHYASVPAQGNIPHRIKDFKMAIFGKHKI